MTDGTGRIEVRGLSTTFVTGFPGPNGAGKATTPRCLIGPTSGTATIDGRAYADLPHPSATVGAMLEASGFHPARSRRNHLRVYCTVNGFPDRRADEVLDIVGLTTAARQKVRGYSMGMRQRLGLAAALLGDPHVLIFDEPANGLAPEGHAWLRRFLRRMAECSSGWPPPCPATPPHNGRTRRCGSTA